MLSLERSARETRQRWRLPDLVLGGSSYLERLAAFLLITRVGFFLMTLGFGVSRTVFFRGVVIYFTTRFRRKAVTSTPRPTKPTVSNLRICRRTASLSL